MVQRSTPYMNRSESESLGRKSFSLILQEISNFKYILSTFLLLVIICSFLQVMVNMYPDILNMFIISSNTPWGVFTCIFVNESEEKLIQNMSGLLIFIILFILCNFNLTTIEKKEKEVYSFHFRNF